MMSKSPFILRSEVIATTAQDAARRETILQELSKAEIDQIAGGTNNKYTYDSDWDPDHGGDGDMTVDNDS